MKHGYWICLIATLWLLSGCTTTGSVRDNPTTETSPTEAIQSNLKNAGATFEKGKLADALFQYTEILKQDPNNRDALIAVGRIYSQAGKVLTAESYFTRVLEINPDDVVAAEERGLARFKLGKKDEASTDFQHALKLDADRWRSWNALGILSDLNGNSVDARAYFYRALEILPESPTLMNNVGYSLITGGEYVKAESMLRESLSIAPDDVGLRNNLGLAIAWQGRYKEAVQIIAAVLPEYAAMNNVGYIAMLRKDKDAAIRLFNEAIKAKPSFYIRAAQNLKKAESMSVNSDGGTAVMQ